MTRVLLITNDFPPRLGGIQSFVHGMATRMNVDHLVVYTSTSAGAQAFDAAQPFPVVRADTTMLLPTSETARAARRIAIEHECDTVLFGAAAPLGLLARGLKRETGIRRAVALTHGHEAGWAVLPGARHALKRLARDIDIITYLADYFNERFTPVIGNLTQLKPLTFGVDTERFRPETDRGSIRKRLGLPEAPTVVCVSRLVPRKGQDRLVDALPGIRRVVPNARLLLVGGGPYESTLRRQVSRARLGHAVTFTGSIDDAQLPSYYAAGDVFAMPCRTRRGGLDVEGLGVVFLEAAASGLPVIVGDSGGAPGAVLHTKTGYHVDGRDVDRITSVLTRLLADPSHAARLGAAGREWMLTNWTWQRSAERLTTMLTH